MFVWEGLYKKNRWALNDSPNSEGSLSEKLAGSLLYLLGTLLSGFGHIVEWRQTTFRLIDVGV